MLLLISLSATLQHSSLSLSLRIKIYLSDLICGENIMPFCHFQVYMEMFVEQPLCAAAAYKYLICVSQSLFSNFVWIIDEGNRVSRRSVCRRCVGLFWEFQQKTMFCEVWPLQVQAAPEGPRVSQTETDSWENQTPCSVSLFPPNRHRKHTNTSQRREDNDKRS